MGREKGEEEKMSLKWVNLFIRDVILIGLISWVNWKVDFQSWWAACVTGMIIVLMTWHLSDLLYEKRGLA